MKRYECNNFYISLIKLIFFFLLLKFVFSKYKKYEFRVLSAEFNRTKYETACVQLSNTIVTKTKEKKNIPSN